MRKQTNSTTFAAIENAAQIVDRRGSEPLLAGCVAPVLASCVPHLLTACNEPLLAGCGAPAHQQLMAACVDTSPTRITKKR